MSKMIHCINRELANQISPQLIPISYLCTHEITDIILTTKHL